MFEKRLAESATELRSADVERDMASAPNAQDGGSPDGIALPTPDFAVIFETMPGMCLVLTPGFVVVAATDMYLQTSMTERSQLIGRYLFDVFPDNPADPDATGVSSVTARLRTACAPTAARISAARRAGWSRGCFT